MICPALPPLPVSCLIVPLQSKPWHSLTSDSLSHHNLRQDEGEKIGNWGDVGHMEALVLFSYSNQTFSAGAGFPLCGSQVHYQQQIW